MKRWILSVFAAATMTLAAMPTTAEACGGYGAQIDPMTVTIETAIADHFQKVRTSVRIQRFANLTYDAGTARATVFFVDRRDRVLSQDIRLMMRGSAWTVVGGARPVQVSNV